MLLKGNENPYLRGKPAKRHIEEPTFTGFNPFSDLSEGDRAKAIDQIGQHHLQVFETGLRRLQELCRSCNVLQLLAHFGYYDQLFLDPNEQDNAYQPVAQGSAEFLQALVLQIPEPELRPQLDTPPEPVIMEVNKLLREMPQAFSLKRYGTNSTGNKAQVLAEIVRAHTVSVRNAGFPTQIRRSVRGLAEALSQQFEQAHGINLTGLVDMLWNIGELVGKRVNEDFSRRKDVLSRKSERQILDAFLKLHCSDDPALAAEFKGNVTNARLKLRDLRRYLINQWDRRNFKLFYISLNELVSCYPSSIERTKLEQIVRSWSLDFGSLALADPEHFFLDNPVWSKPIIYVGADRFFFPIPGLVQSFGQELIENVIRTDPQLWDRYQSKIRPKYLEKFTADLFSSAVPSAKVLTGVHWIDPKSSQNYETDVLIVIDGHVLVIECKAGRLSDRARRGDSVRLAKDLGRLIEEPTLQGQRFANLLSTSKGPIEVEDSHHVKHIIDPSRLLRISRINVTLDCLGPVGIQARLLRELGVVSGELKPAATFHLHELEDCVEILDQPAFLFHYLHRRAELEAANDLLASEGGLLAFYLATGFDLGEFEGGKERLALPSMADELEPYFMGKELNRPVPKPKRRLTGWWKDTLSTLQSRKTYGWMESCYALLSVGYVRQKGFERAGKKVLKGVRSRWRDTNNENACFLIAGSPKRRIKVMYVGVKNVTLGGQRDLVRRAIAVADEKMLTPATVAIVRSASTETYPYSAVYLAGSDYEPFLRGPADSN